MTRHTMPMLRLPLLPLYVNFILPVNNIMEYGKWYALNKRRTSLSICKYISRH